MSAKSIKLYGGPQDGAILEVPYTKHHYEVIMDFPDGFRLNIVYVETDRMSSTGEVIFSCYEPVAA